MAQRPGHGNEDGIDEAGVKVAHPKRSAVGLPAVVSSMQHAVREMGPVRTARTLLAMNQTDGFDCMSCAWPDPEAGQRSHAEFCENGAKAVAFEATRKRVSPAFFAEHSIDELYARDDYWLSRQGRLTTPMLRERGDTHYRPTTWDEAFALIARTLHGLGGPDEAAFYTSGRTSNEAAFLYQLVVRGLGTNNLPDCSNMCHESSGEALGHSIGIGKGSVTLHDVETAKVILIAGQNPGTNHPRMLSSLEKAKQGGAVIVAINPLPEAGLIHYRNPQTVARDGRPGHAAGRPPPPGPAGRGPRAVPRPGEVPPRGGGRRPAHRRHDDGARPHLHRAAHRRPRRVPRPPALHVVERPRGGDGRGRGPDPRRRRGAAAVATARSSRGRWA